MFRFVTLALPGRVPLALVLLGACHPSTPDAAPKAATPTDSATDPDTSVLPSPEACNGVDDDGDGAVDEGFPDADANGRVDCLDVTCPALDVGVAGTVVVDATCSPSLAPVSDPWQVSVLWETPLPELSADEYESVGTQSSLVVAQLDDDNGDGRVDDADAVDVAVLYLRQVDGDPDAVYLQIVDGGTGLARSPVPVGPTWAMGLGVADVDGSGTPELVTITGGDGADDHVVPVDAGGTPLWESDSEVPHQYFPPVFADLDGDGTAEVLAFNFVFDGATGKLRYELELPSATSAIAGAPAVADVDQDGDQEIFLDFRAYDSDGTVLWDGSDLPAPGGHVLAWPFIVQADADPEAEIGFVGDSWALYEHDGTPIFERIPFEDSGANTLSPCVGDLDGDGDSEVVWETREFVHAWELDGTPLWTYGFDDVETSTGCATFDLDGDGAAEVIVGNHASVFVLDGRSGAPRMHFDSYFSIGLGGPVVADVDGDGAAEILVASDSSTGRDDSDATGLLTALTHAGTGWQPAGSTWPVHDFAITNAGPAGEVPTHPDPFWLTHGVYRGRTPNDAPPARANLRVAIPDACVADCTYGPIEVVIQVWNDGGRDVPAGVPLTLYAADGLNLRTIQTVILPEVPAGVALAGISFALTPADVGTDGFLAAVDDDGTGAGTRWECREDDNTAAWTDGCPR